MRPQLLLCNLQVLRDCHFAVPPGQLHMLLGANGCVFQTTNFFINDQPAHVPLGSLFDILQHRRIDRDLTHIEILQRLRLTGAERARCCGWRAGCCSPTLAAWRRRSRRALCSRTRTIRLCCPRRARTLPSGWGGEKRARESPRCMTCAASLVVSYAQVAGTALLPAWTKPPRGIC